MGQNSCSLYFAGCEVRQWARLTQEARVPHVSINYRYLRERCKPERFEVAKHFPSDQEVWLDAGGFGINEEKWDQAALEDYLLEYLAFAEANMGALTYVTELDATALGWDWIVARRNDSYTTVPEDKMVHVWHPEWGVPVLRAMVNGFTNVAVPSMDKGTAANAHGVARSSGKPLMGLRLAHPFELPGGIYKAILSGSWISPTKYGETHVWDHNRMRRYSPKQKDMARKRHANDFRTAGFDPEKMQADDNDEINRYTIWAWQQLEDSLGKSRFTRSAANNGKGVTTSGPEVRRENVDMDMTRVETLLVEGAQILSSRGIDVHAPNLPVLAEPRLIPGFALRPVKVEVPDPEREGELMTVTQQVVTLSGASVRQCDSCSLSGVCPCSQPGAACSLHMPVEIRSTDQLMAVLTTAIELQWQRVAFGKFAEDMEGGYPNQNLSGELDRLFKLISTFKDITDNRDTLSLTVKARNLNGGGGLLRKIFGQQATEPLRVVDADAAEDAVRRAMT